MTITTLRPLAHAGRDGRYVTGVGAMGLSNAERQKRHRERVKGKLATLADNVRYVTPLDTSDEGRTRAFMARAEAAVEGAKVDDLAGLEYTAEMEAAREAVETAWGDDNEGPGHQQRHEQWLKAERARRAADKAADKAAGANAVAAARSPADIRATEKAIARAKVEDHAVAYLRDELGEERFTVFVEMFHRIHHANGINLAMWRIGKLVPGVECGTPISPEGDIARVGVNGTRWIEKAT